MAAKRCCFKGVPAFQRGDLPNGLILRPLFQLASPRLLEKCITVETCDHLLSQHVLL